MQILKRIIYKKIFRYCISPAIAIDARNNRQQTNSFPIYLTTEATSIIIDAVYIIVTTMYRVE